MSEPCIIQADYVDWRTVKGRKSLQLIFEVDLARQTEVLGYLGAPRSDASIPCAIALLDLKAIKAEPQASEAGGSPKKHWSEYARSQQAAILCHDKDFWRYFKCVDEHTARAGLYEHFRISSRSELDRPENAARWDEFVALFHLHCDRQYAGSKR